MNEGLAWIVISFAAALCDTFIRFSFFNGFLDRKKIDSRRFNIQFGVIWIITSLINIFFSESIVFILCSLCLNLSIVFYFYNAKGYIKLFSVILFIGLCILTQAFTVFALSTLKDMTIQLLSKSVSVQAVSSILSKIVLLLIIKAIGAFQRAKTEEIWIKYLIILLLIAIASILIVYQIWNSSLETLQVDSTLTIISIISMLNMNIMTFALFEGLMRQAEDQLKCELAKQQLDLQLSHYLELNENRKFIRGIWHDMKNHLFCIHTLAVEGKYDLILKYIDGLSNITQKLMKTIDTGNPVLDALIEGKRCKATEIGINMEVNIIVPENIVIDQIDICVILGNALDNAIEACNRLKDKIPYRVIQVKIGYKGDYFIISISNTSDDCLYNKNGNYATKKIDKRIHGLGLQNIERAVKKYNGNMKVSYEKNEFILNIIMLAAVA